VAAIEATTHAARHFMQFPLSKLDGAHTFFTTFASPQQW
jgi:hypothetical protein